MNKIIKIRSNILAPIVLGTFILGIALSMAFNLWKTETEKIAAKYVSGEYEGISNPADIRGSYSIADVEQNFAIPADLLIQAFGLPADTNPAEFQIKEFEEMYEPLAEGGELGTDSMRLFVASYLGLPYTPEETSLLLTPALSILQPKLATADFELLQAIAVSPSVFKTGASTDHDAEIDGDANSATDEEEEHAEKEDMVVKGNTTFYDLLDWGLSKEQIEEILKQEMGSTSVPIRDFLMERELEFSEYKTAFQELLDALK